MKTYHVIVIGSGPGGYVAAERAAARGKSVLLLEKEELGGVCTNWGCIPTKSLLNSAKLYSHALASKQFGVTVESARFSLKDAMAWKEETVRTLRKGIGFLLKKHSVDVLFAEAECLDPNHVRAGDKTFQCDHLIIATGSSAALPPIPGIEQEHVLTNREILSIQQLPKKLVVIGGGVVGMEFASFFSQVGTEVHVIEMLDEVLPLMDPEMAKLMRREMKQITYHLGCQVTGIGADAVTIRDKQGKEKRIQCDVVLVSVGRTLNSEGLKPLHLDIRNGAAVTDEHMRTSVPSVYAVGDVTGSFLLAHSASRMAEVAVDSITGGSSIMRYEAVPWAIYTQPEAAACGYTEAEAQKAGFHTLSAAVQMRSNGRFLAEHGKKAGGLCKVVADANTRRIIGVHLLGPASSEIIYGAAAIIESELRIEDVKEIIFPHPSISEIIKDALWAMDDQ